jgi:hypothetical protein
MSPGTLRNSFIDTTEVICRLDEGCKKQID